MPRSYAFIPAITAVIFFGLYFLFGQNKPKISKETTILVVLILVLSASSLLWAKYFDTSKAKVFKLLALLPPQILLISLATSLNKDQLKPLEKYLPIGFIAASIFLIFEMIMQGVLHDLVRGMPVSHIADPTDFNRGSVALVLYSFSIFGLLSLKYNSYKAILVFIPLAIAVFISRSQSAQLALLVGSATLFLFPYQFKMAWKILKYAIIVLILATPFVTSYVYENFAQDLQNIPVLAKGYAGDRLEIWDYISRYALQSPWLGYGIEATRDVTDFDSQYIFSDESDVLHPHNFVVQIWMEFGLLGISILIGLIYALFTKLENQCNLVQQKIFLPTVMAVLVPASLAYGLWQGLWIGLMFHVAAVAIMVSVFTVED